MRIRTILGFDEEKNERAMLSRFRPDVYHSDSCFALPQLHPNRASQNRASQKYFGHEIAFQSLFRQQG